MKLSRMFVIDHAKRTQASIGTYDAAQFMRCAGVSLDIALLTLVGRPLQGVQR